MRTLVILKPDAVEDNLVEAILDRFVQAGLALRVIKRVKPSAELMNQHYPIEDTDYVRSLGHVDVENLSPEELAAVEEKNRGIIRNMQAYFQAGEVVPMVLESDGDTIQQVRDLVGKTNPAAAVPGTIRGDFGKDSYDQADREGRAVHNLVHASDSPENADREIRLWFPDRSDLVNAQ